MYFYLIKNAHELESTALELETLKYKFLGINDLSISNEDAINLILKNGTKYVSIARDSDGVLVGAICFNIRDNVLNITDMFIDPLYKDTSLEEDLFQQIEYFQDCFKEFYNMKYEMIRFEDDGKHDAFMKKKCFSKTSYDNYIKYV